ncbi:gustatory receptor 30, partial [Danaus plexippus plexippus]
MFVSIICSLPKLISNVYHILLVFENHEPIQSIGFVLIHMCHTCFLLFSPCVVVELQCLEVDRIRLILVNQLLIEDDPKIRDDLQLFIQYTDVRKYQFKIWRCIPLNISLPIEIANICVSSVIVVINFTHLYD